MSIVSRLFALFAILAAIEFGYRGQLFQMAVASFLSLILLCIEFGFLKPRMFTLLNSMFTLGLLITAVMHYGAMDKQADIMNKQSVILLQQLDEAKKERIAASEALKAAENAQKVAEISAKNAKNVEERVNTISISLKEQMLSFISITMLENSRGTTFGGDYYWKVIREVLNESIRLLEINIPDFEERKKWADKFNNRVGARVLIIKPAK